MPGKHRLHRATGRRRRGLLITALVLVLAGLVPVIRSARNHPRCGAERGT